MHYVTDESIAPCLRSHMVNVSNTYDCLESIIDISVGYDGMDGSIDSMRQLVDELRDYAIQALKFMSEGKVNEADTYEEDRLSYETAIAMRKEIGEPQKCCDCSWKDKCIKFKKDNSHGEI